MSIEIAENDSTTSINVSNDNKNYIKKEMKIQNKGEPFGVPDIKIVEDQMQKTICKIYCKNNNKLGTGFLCELKMQDSNSIVNVLITCNHILSKDEIKIGQVIIISFNNENEYFKITIDESTRKYTNIDYDITIIEIRHNKYREISFLEIDDDISKENQTEEYKNNDIYLLHYQQGQQVVLSSGKIINLDIKQIKIKHNGTTQEGSSGSPIINKNSYKVIGIHTGNNQKEKLNDGTFIKKPIDAFFEKYKNALINHKKESNIVKINTKPPNKLKKIIILMSIILFLIILTSIFLMIYFLIIKPKNSDDKKPLVLDNYITIIYKKQIDKLGSIRIFSDDFVESNLNLCDIYYDGKKYNLKNYFEISDMNKKDEILKIYLTGINNIKEIKGMFKECKALISLTDISKLNTTNINDMSEMFSGCNSLTDLPNTLNWNTENVLNMRFMFYECESLTSLPDISNWKTDNVIDFSGMFFGCSSLKALPDISIWSTYKVYNITRMFSACSSIRTLPDISKWNTSNIVNMSDIFSGCHSLSSLPDISKWKTDKVTDMCGMFYTCKSLTSMPDISKWNVTKVTNMRAMFYQCESLKSFPDISNWNISNNPNVNTEYMFYGCKFKSPIN